MAGGHPSHESRYYYDDYPQDDRDADRNRRHHRRHRSHREYDQDEENYIAARRERRERRQAAEARRGADEEYVYADDLSFPRESYYSRPEPERRREAQRMAQEPRTEREAKARSSRRVEVRRDGTVRRRKKEAVRDDHSDDYVYGRPKSGGVIEQVTVHRSSARRRSDGGGSSSRTPYSPPSGSRSVSHEEIPKLSRTKSAREPAQVYITKPSTRRHSTKAAPAPVTRTRSASVREPHQRRNPGILATLFAPAPRPQTAIVHKEVPLVECLVCMRDDLPSTRTAKLGCGHRMCHSCLKRQFLLSVKDPQHMPPRCCTQDHIPLKYVERLFDDKFKRTWNRKYQEYTTANRLYCPSKGCGEWIKPSKMRMDLTYGRPYAKCGRCGTKVCPSCNDRFHTRRECPKDPETRRIVQMAKEKGWQRCYNCKTLVELKEGCNHMTCRCTAQFCMVCAAPWKTCNCPWFNYQFDEQDRLMDMRVPDNNVIEVIEEPEMPTSVPSPTRRTSTRIRHRTERDLDLGDETLAAHIQSQLRLDDSSTPSVRHDDPPVQVYGLGNSGAHHMNESYTLRPMANTSARATAHMSTPGIFSRRLSVRESPRVSTRPTSMPSVASVRASTMAGLALNGSKRGANRVGTWLDHVQVDHEATHTAPRDVEVDDWRIEGSIAGID